MLFLKFLDISFFNILDDFTKCRKYQFPHLHLIKCFFLFIYFYLFIYFFEANNISILIFLTSIVYVCNKTFHARGQFVSREIDLTITFIFCNFIVL